MVLYADRCPELCHGTGDKPAKCFWARRRQQSNMGDVVVATRHRPADQWNPLTGYRPWDSLRTSIETHYVTGHNPGGFWSVLRTILTQAINETTREDALLALLFMKKDELIHDVMVKFACSNHEAVEC